jgi:zinc transport system substrate-binding protein
MKKNIIVIIVILILVTGAVFVGLSLKNNNQVKGDKISVVTTLFPLYDFVKEIGGDKVQVSLLLPPGVEAHAFEPKPSDIVKINESDLFVYTGKFMEPWAEDIIKGITNKDTKIVDSSIGIELMKDDDPEEEHKGVFEEELIEKHEEEHGHNHSGVDPHIWLGFDNSQIMVSNITKMLAEKDPINADFYNTNASLYLKKLSALDESYKNTLSVCKTREVVYGGHYAFGYLAKRYNLEYVSAQGFSPDSEPTVKDMIALVDQINKNNINYVFYEELASPKIAETLSMETGAKLLLLNGAHNISKEEMENNVSFLSIMEKNLVNLKTGLSCGK